ncbi:hypothetical protein GPECTOR_24g211 [Gonium pectorale]|uniref:Uncharacterized protein n=1 Tax=Gonium pectorale TaxID=33097 RepID=A0A150GGF8_GONPE|nr:hypothetical protein GPECTOR_24g211 [Gonium pectorale]|eukprot:KXZ48922.1 hypothetical protein GPECTOR_24g211 [Gonium pectorale]
MQQEYAREAAALAEPDPAKDANEAAVAALVGRIGAYIDRLRQAAEAAAKGGAAAAASWRGGGGDRVNEHTAAHMHGVVLILAEKLHRATRAFDRLRAGRYQALVEHRPPGAAVPAAGLGPGPHPSAASSSRDGGGSPWAAPGRQARARQRAVEAAGWAPGAVLSALASPALRESVPWVGPPPELLLPPPHPETNRPAALGEESVERDERARARATTPKAYYPGPEHVPDSPSEPPQQPPPSSAPPLPVPWWPSLEAEDGPLDWWRQNLAVWQAGVRRADLALPLALLHKHLELDPKLLPPQYRTAAVLQHPRSAMTAASGAALPPPPPMVLAASGHRPAASAPIQQQPLQPLGAPILQVLIPVELAVSVGPP